MLLDSVAALTELAYSTSVKFVDVDLLGDASFRSESRTDLRFQTVDEDNVGFWPSTDGSPIYRICTICSLLSN